MHQSAYDKTKVCVEGYLAAYKDKPLDILDIGSCTVDVQTFNHRSLCRDPWKYTGMDIEAGENVHIVVREPYDWKEIESARYDVVLCGQAFEHIRFPWLTIKEIQRVLKPGGIAIITAPSGGPEHKYPVDCWRIYPDGFQALCDYAGLRMVEHYTQFGDFFYTDGSDKWHDSIAIMQRPAEAGEEAAFPAFENKQLMQAHEQERTHRPSRKALRRRFSHHLREIGKTLRRAV